ncbi:MAG: SDR family oxidoreductase [Prolixibacteraceae bacterium]|jgi:NAD(P)-dependent dehydrogenase (short-subunit alcohol dehydrogenase family)|nr:SDR family oxidoreductase [Prolixibacteraceae bacterium]
MMYKDKVVLITGSSVKGSLGATIAMRCAAEGAKGVVLTGLLLKQDDPGELIAEIKKLGADAIFIQADLKKPEEITSLVEQAEKHFGRIDGLVNAAGITTRGTIEESSVELWDEHIAINARAPFLLMQAVIRLWQREKTAGSIVNIVTMSAHGGQPFITPYCASKGALLTLTKNVAHSQRFNRIRVNAILPGWMDTAGETSIQKRFHNAPDNWLALAEAKQPMGKLIKPAELAGLAVYLLSDESGVITGSTIDYDQNVMGAYD